MVRHTRWVRPGPPERARCAASAAAPVGGTGLPRPGPAGLVSCTGCVDTSIPLVTAAERTAGPLDNEALAGVFV